LVKLWKVVRESFAAPVNRDRGDAKPDRRAKQLEDPFAFFRCERSQHNSLATRDRLST
jgi:hypothetical protein